MQTQDIIKKFSETNLQIKDKEYNIVHNNGDIVEVDEIPITHEFADQVYLRQMKMKAGQMILGAQHKDKHIWFLLSGKVSIKNKDKITTYVGPCYKVSESGAQRIIYAHKDSVFVNIHKNPNNITDIKKLETLLVYINRKKT